MDLPVLMSSTAKAFSSQPAQQARHQQAAAAALHSSKARKASH
jgi:hypothetical protein